MPVTDYKIETGPARPSFAPYAGRITNEFSSLLSRGASEPELQEFFEHNPCFAPGARTPSLSTGHSPLHGALVTQPTLPGFHSRVPDFMWIAVHSYTWYPTLIEIEDSTKKLFTKNGRQTAKFSEAKNQLDRWHSWFDNPTNIHQFIELYGIPPSWRANSNWKLHMILVYGRRSEFNNHPEISKLRSSLMRDSQSEMMSFDRLSPDPNLELMITVRALGDGRFKAIWVPETFGIVPYSTDSLQYIDCLEDAIDLNAAISEDRRTFLKERIKYWRRVGAPKSGSSEIFSIE